MREDKPAGWGSDSLSALLDVARDNELAVFHNRAAEFALLRRADEVFMTATAAMPNTSDWFPGLLLISSHRSFRSGAHLALSGFVPESYACGRLVLEYSLSSLHLAKSPDSQLLWMSRHDSDDCKLRIRREFSYAALLRELRDIDSARADKVSVLYERMIDRGAHPNQHALTQVLEIEEQTDHKKFKVAHLSGDNVAVASAMKSLTQCGVCALDVFSVVYPERFALMGIESALDSLKSSL